MSAVRSVENSIHLEICHSVLLGVTHPIKFFCVTWERWAEGQSGSQVVNYQVKQSNCNYHLKSPHNLKTRGCVWSLRVRGGFRPLLYIVCRCQGIFLGLRLKIGKLKDLASMYSSNQLLLGLTSAVVAKDVEHVLLCRPITNTSSAPLNSAYYTIYNILHWR